MAGDEKNDPFEGMVTHTPTSEVESTSEGSQDPSFDTVQDDTSKGVKNADETTDDKANDEGGNDDDETGGEDEDEGDGDTGESAGDDDDLDDLFGNDDGADDSAEGDDDGTGDDDIGDSDDSATDDDAGDPPAEEDKKPKRPKRTARERIAELTKHRRTAEDRALMAEQQNEALMKRLDDLEKKLTDDPEDGKDKDQTADKSEGEPDPTKYEYGELDPKYVSDLTDYRVDKRLNKDKAADQEKQQKEAAELHAKELQTQYSAKVDDGKKVYKDFEKVVVTGANNNAYPLTPETAQMALESPVGHHVIYKIAGNLKLAKRLASQTPLQQARTFGRLEAQFSSKDASRKNKTPNAGPPPKRRSGSGGVSKPDPQKESFADFEKRAMASLKET